MGPRVYAEASNAFLLVSVVATERPLLLLEQQGLASGHLFLLLMRLLRIPPPLQGSLLRSKGSKGEGLSIWVAIFFKWAKEP